MIDKNLSWEPHTCEISKKFSAKVKKLYQMRNMPKSTLSTIYFQGILIWGNCSPSLMTSLEKIHIRAARFICKLKKKVSDMRVLDQVKWKPICYYYKRSLACKAYKIYNEIGSPLLNNLIQKSSSTRTTRNSMRLDFIKYKYVGYKRSFAYRVAILWNNIPIEIREKTSFNSFKVALKKSLKLILCLLQKPFIMKIIFITRIQYI